jgi:predicted Zn-dependent peptidase
MILALLLVSACMLCATIFSISYLFVHVFQLLTYGRRIPFAELFARIDAVDASTIKRVANRFIYDKVI